MKKISLFAILGLVASLALADTVYYPGNTYKVDGNVQFINSGQRPTWNDNGTAYGLATTNDIKTIVGDYATKTDLQNATNGLYNSVSDNFVDNNELTQSNTTLSNNIMSVVSDNYIDNNELTQSNTTLSNNIMSAVSGSYIDDSELQGATNALYNSVSDNFVDNSELTQSNTTLSNNIMSAVSNAYIDNSELQGATNALYNSVSDNFIDNTELAQNNTTLSNNIMSAVSDGYIDNSELQTATNALNTSIMGSVVKSVNTKKGDLTITAGDNIDIDNSGSTEIKISAIESPKHSIKTWTGSDVENFDEYDTGKQEIPTDKYAEQYFTAASSQGQLMAIASKEITEVGTLVLYFQQNYEESKTFDIASDNIIGFPSQHLWLNTEGNVSIWKLELEAIPGSENWYFKKATGYVIDE